MTKTDTPRTDAARTLGGVIVNDSWALLGEPRSFASINVVPADFARDLELELTLSLQNQLKSQAEVERLKQWKDTLISNLMALEIYKHNHEDDPAVALAAYGQWNWKAGEWEKQAEVERLQSQLARAVEIAEEFRQVKALHYQCNCARCQMLAELKGEIK